MDEAKTILFVCTGNTCRSFMAETIAKNHLLTHHRDTANIRIISAGTGTAGNDPPTPEALKVIRERGMDANEHSSRVLTPKLVEEADLILVMTQRHKDCVLRLAPQARDKVHLLKEYARDPVQWDNLNREAQQLYEEIESKKRGFYTAHQSEIERLENRKRKLLDELGEIEKELGGWEDRLGQVAFREEMCLRQMEREINDPDVIDPFGQPLEYYRICADQLEEYVLGALKKYLSAFLRIE